MESPFVTGSPVSIFFLVPGRDIHNGFSKIVQIYDGSLLLLWILKSHAVKTVLVSKSVTAGPPMQDRAIELVAGSGPDIKFRKVSMGRGHS